MKLLLDTHIWIWSLAEPDRLARSVRSALEDSDNELWLSPISSWEACLLMERGRIHCDKEPSLAVKEMLLAGPFRETPLNHAVSIASRSIDVDHADPADRFIAATALVYDLTLVTADRRLHALKQIDVMENR